MTDASCLHSCCRKPLAHRICSESLSLGAPQDQGLLRRHQNAQRNASRRAPTVALPSPALHRGATVLAKFRYTFLVKCAMSVGLVPAPTLAPSPALQHGEIWPASPRANGPATPVCVSTRQAGSTSLPISALSGIFGCQTELGILRRTQVAGPTRSRRWQEVAAAAGRARRCRSRRSFRRRRRSSSTTSSCHRRSSSRNCSSSSSQRSSCSSSRSLLSLTARLCTAAAARRPLQATQSTKRIQRAGSLPRQGGSRHRLLATAHSLQRSPALRRQLRTGASALASRRPAARLRQLQNPQQRGGSLPDSRLRGISSSREPQQAQMLHSQMRGVSRSGAAQQPLRRPI